MEYNLTRKNLFCISKSNKNKNLKYLHITFVEADIQGFYNFFIKLT